MNELAQTMAERWRRWCAESGGLVRVCWVTESTDGGVNVHIVAASAEAHRGLRDDAHRLQQTLRIETNADLHVTVWRPKDAGAGLGELEQPPIYGKAG